MLKNWTGYVRFINQLDWRVWDSDSLNASKRKNTVWVVTQRQRAQTKRSPLMIVQY